MKKRTFFFMGVCVLALALAIPSVSAIDEWESLSGTYYQEVRQSASSWSAYDYNAGSTPVESLTTCLQYSFTEEGTKDLGAYTSCGNDNGLLGESSVILYKGVHSFLHLTNTSHSYPGTFTELTWTANNLDIHQSELPTLNVRFVFSYDNHGTPTNLDYINIYNFSGLTIPDGMHLAQLNITGRIRNDTSGATNYIDIDYFKVSAGYEPNTFWSYSSPGNITDYFWYFEYDILIDDEDDGYTHPGGLMTSDTFRDERVQLIYNESFIGDNKAEDGTWDVSNNMTWEGWTFYGDSCGMNMDSFNASLTPNIVNDETFGLHFMVEQDPGSGQTSWFNVTDFSFDIPDDHDIYGCEVMVNKMNYNNGVISSGCVKYVGMRIYHGRDAFIIPLIHPDWAEQPVDDSVLTGSLPDGVRGSVPVIVRSKTQPSLDINFSFIPSTDGNESVSSFYEDDYQHMEQWDELDSYNTNYSLLITVNNTNQTQGLFLIQTGNNTAPEITMDSHHIPNGTTNINLTQFASIPWQFTISDYDDTTTNVTLSNGQTNYSEGGSANLLPSSLDFSTNYTMWVNSTDEFGLSTNQWYWFTTRDPFIPDPPTDVSADDDNTYINIEWTPADDSRTVIEYQNGTYPSGWDLGNQTVLYNDTGLSYNHLVGFNKTVTYVLWSYYPADNSYSNESVVVSTSTPVPVYPEQPTEEMVSIDYNSACNGTVSYTIDCEQVVDADSMIIATFPDGDTNISNATELINATDFYFPYWYDTVPGNDTIIGFYGWNSSYETYGDPLFISFEPFDFIINDSCVYAGGNTSIFLDDSMDVFDGDLMCSFAVDYIRDDGMDTVYHNTSIIVENGTWTTVDFPLLPFWNTTSMTTNISLTLMDDGVLWGSFDSHSFSSINYSYILSGVENDTLTVTIGNWGSGSEPFTDYHVSYYGYRFTLFGESYYYDDENPTSFALPFIGFDNESYMLELLGFTADYPEPTSSYVSLSGATHDSSLSVTSPFHMNMSEDGVVSDYFNGKSLSVRGSESIRYREWLDDGSTILLQNSTDPSYSSFDEVDANPYGTNFSDYWINISYMLSNTSTYAEANQTGTLACFSTSDNSTRNATHLELYLSPLPDVVYPQSGGATGQITFYIFYESMAHSPYDDGEWDYGVEDDAIEVTLDWTANLHRLYSYFRVELPHRLTDIRDIWMEDAPMGVGVSHLRLMDAPSGQTRDVRLYGTLNDFSIENEIRVMNGDDVPFFNFTIESRTFTEGGTTVIYPVLAFRSLLPDGSFSDEEIIPFDVLHEPMDFILSFTRNTAYGMIDTRDEVLVTFQSAYGKGQRVIEDFSYETIKEIQLTGNMDVHHLVIEQNLAWYEDMTTFDLPYPDGSTIDLEGNDTFLFTVDMTNITPVDSGLCRLVSSGIVWNDSSWVLDYNHTYTEFMLMKDGSYQFPVDVVPGFSSYLRFEYWNETSQEWEDLMTKSSDLYDGSSVHSPRSIRYNFTIDESITIDIDSPSSGSYDTDWNPDFSGSLGDNDDDKDVYLRCYMYMDSDSTDGGTLASRIENYSFTTTWLTKITEDSFDYDDYFRDILPFGNMDYYIEYYLYDPLWQNIMLDDENYTMGHPLSCLDHGWLNITRGCWQTQDTYRHPVDYYFASTGILPVDGDDNYVSFIEDGLRMNLWNYHLRDPDYSRWGGGIWDFFQYHLFGDDVLPWTIALYQEPETLIYNQMIPPIEETTPGTNDTFLVHQEDSFFEDGNHIQEGGVHTHIGYQYQVLPGTFLSGRNQYHLRIGYAVTVNRNTAMGGLPWDSGLDIGRDLFDSIPDDYSYVSDSHNINAIQLTLSPWRLGFLYYEHTFGTFPEGESYSELDSDSDYDQYQDSELKENVETLGELWGVPYLGVLVGLLLIILFSVMPLFAQAYVFKGQHKRDVPLPVYGVFMFIGVGLSYSFGFLPLWVIAISVSIVGIFTIWHVMRRTGHAPVLFTDRMVYNKGNKGSKGDKGNKGSKGGKNE